SGRPPRRGTLATLAPPAAAARRRPPRDGRPGGLLLPAERRPGGRPAGHEVRERPAPRGAEAGGPPAAQELGPGRAGADARPGGAARLLPRHHPAAVDGDGRGAAGLPDARRPPRPPLGPRPRPAAGGARAPRPGGGRARLLGHRPLRGEPPR